MLISSYLRLALWTRLSAQPEAAVGVRGRKLLYDRHMAQYFVRHGQTDWNLERRIQGKADIELNDTGRRQSAETRDKLSDRSFVVIFTSPLKRAVETAKIIAEAHPDTPLVEVEALAERDFGRFEGIQNNPQDDYFGVWNYASEVDTDGGESLADLEARVYPFLEHIGEEYADKDVLLVSHVGVGLMMYQYYWGKPKSGNLLDCPLVMNGAVEVLGSEPKEKNQ